MHKESPKKTAPGVRTPKVSVVLPNYNHARFLPQRLQSIFSQTFTDWELIYLDDASRDDSNAVFETFVRAQASKSATEKVSARLLSETNSGSPFVQWNRGVRAARGEYVWIAEADDDAHLGLLAVLVGALDAHKNVGLAYCHSIEIDEKGNEIGLFDYARQNLNPSDWSRNWVRAGGDEIHAHLAFRNTIPNASAVLLRRDLYNHIGGADETMRLNGDWRLWLAFARHSSVAFVAEPFNRFRRHSQTVRAASGRGVREAGELYTILGDIAPIVAQMPEREQSRLFDEYAVVLLSQLLGRRAAPADNRAVFQAARRLDPALTRRLLRGLANRIAENYGSARTPPPRNGVPLVTRKKRGALEKGWLCHRRRVRGRHDLVATQHFRCRCDL